MPDYAGVPNMGKTHLFELLQRLIVNIVELATTVFFDGTVILIALVGIAKQTRHQLVYD